jgi:hypothetical protein
MRRRSFTIKEQFGDFKSLQEVSELPGVPPEKLLENQGR